ncbi:MAG: hypothetical protein WD060_01875 [Pirellulales bacterium]
MSEEKRLATVARTLALAMLLCLGFSWRLWISTRLYPLVPALGLVPRFPWPLDVAVLVLLVVLLIALAFRPLSRPLAGAIVAVVAVLFLQDQSRLWPSFYLFFFLLLLLSSHGREGGEPAAGRTLAGMRFAVAMAYFWGGVQKLTPHFFCAEFPWFLKPLTDLVPVPIPGLPVIAAMAAGFEVLFGLGLLTKRFQAVAMYEGLAMHALILICIGPLRGNWNDSAWIWGQTMAVLLVLLFYAAPPFRMTVMFDGARARNLVQAAVVVFLGVLPVLNNVNRWDSAISFNIYSGNVNRAQVLMYADEAATLPAEMAVHVAIQGEWAVFDPNAWSMQQFNAGVYPEERIFRAILGVVCRKLPTASARLVVEEKASWFLPKATHIHACGDR